MKFISAVYLVPDRRNLTFPKHQAFQENLFIFENRVREVIGHYYYDMFMEHWMLQQKLKKT